MQDPSGDFVKQWVPEVSKLPKKYLHQPWLAPAEAQKSAGLVLGETYPHRITGNAVMQVLADTLDYSSFADQVLCFERMQMLLPVSLGTSNLQKCGRRDLFDTYLSLTGAAQEECAGHQAAKEDCRGQVD